LDVIGTKILGVLLYAFHSHHHQQILLSSNGFLGLEISAATAKTKSRRAWIFSQYRFVGEESTLPSTVCFYASAHA